jgi:hypothetical protein
MKVLRIAALSLVLLAATSVHPCQPEKFIDYYSDYFITHIGWSWCGCQGQTAQGGQQSGAYRRVTTVGCLHGQETETCHQWNGSTWVVVACP